MERLNMLELVTVLLAFTVISVNGQQINTPCTSSMINSFTPCFNFVTGSTNNGSITPNSTCCEAFKSLMSTSTDCACRVITASVPIQLPISLGVSLPQACNMGGVAAQCKASGAPLPTPGPALLRPPPPATAAAPGKADAPLSPTPIASSPSSPGSGAANSRPRRGAASPLSPRGSKVVLVTQASLLQSKKAPAPMKQQVMAETAETRQVVSPSASVLSCIAPSSFLLIVIAVPFIFNFY